MNYDNKKSSILIEELVKNMVREELRVPQQPDLFEGVFSFLKKAFAGRKSSKNKEEKEKYLKSKKGKNEIIAKTARSFADALDRLEYKNEIDKAVFYDYVKPLLRRIERLERAAGESDRDDLFEQSEPERIVGGPEPMRMGGAYYGKEAIMKRVQEVILDKAPQGTQSQGQFLDILSQACDQVSNELQDEAGGDLDTGADHDLTLAMCERTLMNIPHGVFFAALSNK